MILNGRVKIKYDPAENEDFDNFIVQEEFTIKNSMTGTIIDLDPELNLNVKPGDRVLYIPDHMTTKLELPDNIVYVDGICLVEKLKGEGE